MLPIFTSFVFPYLLHNFKVWQSRVKVLDRYLDTDAPLPPDELGGHAHAALAVLHPDHADAGDEELSSCHVSSHVSHFV